LSNNLFEGYSNSNFKNLNWNYSKFNQPLNNSLDNILSLTHLIFWLLV